MDRFIIYRSRYFQLQGGPSSASRAVFGAATQKRWCNGASGQFYVAPSSFFQLNLTQRNNMHHTQSSNIHKVLTVLKLLT